MELRQLRYFVAIVDHGSLSRAARVLHVSEEVSGNLIEQLKSGRINLAVLFDDEQLTPFTTTPLVEEQLMFITRSDSRFASKAASITLADALRVPLILPSLPHGVRPR